MKPKNAPIDSLLRTHDLRDKSLIKISSDALIFKKFSLAFKDFLEGTGIII